MNPDQQFGLTMTVIFAIILPGMLALVIPLGKAWARRVEHGTQHDDSETQAELERVKGRLAELEERLDFTERVLSQHRDAGKLGAGEHQ